ncbi:molybdate ABC transporter permease subunit [Campylobacter pinnipediorum]|uniref:molybdate ABC transporter permease subunit n=1 Tax=Campylobacter pinnipediorum TaxID=1965231 RepID=UPI00084CF8F8|nr:molybdate ABC transporter permease subunit [Campylobacter pinnipediorum]AQW81750.1 molybdenum ABC transporter ModABC, permease protein [Campylobacter pinnipediorum subsp. pinnipediorum]AQW83426.1 molybdenum ABC transporter ModABC, permease protein [Campylobacter pinnipediorum subsp. pinnipediorum]AQW84947.1 molybdenum ABC transporter ModABC, permease protein [Campylobacter pinnipediorum subsp. pinnipediorum]OPA79799.1 molybdenum ABC transporter permease subunit [Campylobacter pinnipediorum s
MFGIDFSPFYVSLKLSLITTFILFVVVTPLAYFFARVDFRFKPFFESLVSLPLVLPPSVLGFYLLLFLSPYSTFGKFIESTFDIRLVFNFYGLVVASCIYSLPFMFSPLQSGFSNLKNNLFEASYSLGKGKLATLFFVALPNIKSSLLTALVISFAHTMGEFGVVLMIGGSIGDETRVASIAIFESVEMLDYDKANIYSMCMLVFSFSILFLLYFLNLKTKNNFK